MRTLGNSQLVVQFSDDLVCMSYAVVFVCPFKVHLILLYTLLTILSSNILGCDNLS